MVDGYLVRSRVVKLEPGTDKIKLLRVRYVVGTYSRALHVACRPACHAGLIDSLEFLTWCHNPLSVHFLYNRSSLCYIEKNHVEGSISGGHF